MGTINVLEAIRLTPSIQAAVIVTTDKCYKNKEWSWPYREIDELGGNDPYAASKSCAEIATHSYIYSFFHEHSQKIATARSGNLLGGGDWGHQRILPDILNNFLYGDELIIRSPFSTRPWQCILNTLYGYLLLAQNLIEKPTSLAQSYNFGPSLEAPLSVKELLEKFDKKLSLTYSMQTTEKQFKESTLLMLDSSLAQKDLAWKPLVSLDECITLITEWVLSYKEQSNTRHVLNEQIQNFISRCED